MKWLNPNRSTSNFEDRRGRGRRRGALLGGGIGGIVVIVLGLFLGINPSQLNNVIGGIEGTGEEVVDPARQHENEELKDFTLLVFNSCNDVWRTLFRENLSQDYRMPTLVAFTDEVQSACGGATAQVGPFYCPADEKVYIDMNFFHELAQRFKAPGDLAMAYVTAHEVGHHVQNLLGLSETLNEMRRKLSETEFNRYSVQMELNADYLAGVWAHQAQRLGIIAIEPGDVEETLRAAEAIGDDTLQKQARGYAVPETFTHGTSRQRMEAFLSGFETGRFTGRELTLR